MAVADGARSVAVMTTRTPLTYLLAALGALYVAGIALALSGDLASPAAAIFNGSELNAPAVIIAAQLLGGTVALRATARRATGGAALLIAACTISLAAAAFDGDIGAGGLSAGQVGYQLLITAVTAATWLVALLGLRRRVPASTAPVARPTT